MAKRARTVNEALGGVGEGTVRRLKEHQPLFAVLERVGRPNGDTPNLYDTLIAEVFTDTLPNSDERVAVEIFKHLVEHCLTDEQATTCWGNWGSLLRVKRSKPL